MRIWVMELVSGHNAVIPVTAATPRKSKLKHGEAVIIPPVDRNGEFNPIVVPKHESRGLSEKLIYLPYSKGNDIEEESLEIDCP